MVYNQMKHLINIAMIFNQTLQEITMFLIRNFNIKNPFYGFFPSSLEGKQVFSTNLCG
jgi:hypothetical protein